MARYIAHSGDEVNRKKEKLFKPMIKKKRIRQHVAVVQRSVMLIKVYIDRYGVVRCSEVRCDGFFEEKNSAP